MGAGFERGERRGVGVVGRSLAAVFASRNADVDARIDFAFPLHSRQSPFCFARDVIG